VNKPSVFRVIAALLRIRLSRLAADPSSFWAAFFVDTTVFFVQAAAFSVIYLNVESINGWDLWRSVLFVGTFTLIDGIYMFLYFFGLIRIPEIVNSGKLDLYLVKPFDPLLHLSFDSVDPGSGFLAIPALFLIGTAAANLGMEIGFWNFAGYALGILLMLVLMYSLMVLVRIPAFWFGRATAFQNAENSLAEFAFRIPGKVWTGALRILFCAALPYGLIATFPATIFFGEAGLGDWALAIGVTCAFTLFARLAWRAGLRRYSGAGG
jgi:ABC-2 type transport system permease protein